MTQIADATSQIDSVSAQIDEKSDEISDVEDKEDLDEMSDEKIRALMAANSAAWWKASTQSEKDALHQANVTLNNLLTKPGNYISSTGKWAYANGTSNASGGLSLVGENGPELRLLNSGDGILPAKVTPNLMQLGQYSPTQWFSQLKGEATGTGYGNNMSLSVANVTLPNVSNAQEFVAGLKNLAVQYSTQRK